ncbi:MAG: DUF1963 domain-containing protein [Bacteroidetes bacterium]|uniref:DUF1963 domain-containing protein n=1 Tax=Candidatus Merdivivens pullicola TaxID=2840872 RepID=A0A9D9NFR7_9BACT|nr:DUF1963 domain-containing protein [Candidatus Merdivivens pullicola]
MTRPIHIITTDSGERSLSHFWGSPLLPPGYPYPEYTDSKGDIRPYNFICQIALENIADFDPENMLPHEGLMLFFSKIDHYLGDFEPFDAVGGYISDAEDVKVLYFPDITGFEEIRIVDEEGIPLSPQELAISFSDKPAGRYSDEHMLLAPPSHREWENWDHPFEDWLILLQIDSFDGKDFNLNFMDSGVLDFLISEKDLAERRFDNIRAIVLST